MDECIHVELIGKAKASERQDDVEVCQIARNKENTSYMRQNIRDMKDVPWQTIRSTSRNSWFLKQKPGTGSRRVDENVY
jgi:hypothetical protein